MTIEQVNNYSSKLAIWGWFAGVAYYGWWTSSAPTIPLWGYAALIIIGMFAASIIVGGGLALIAAGVTKLVTGGAERSTNAYAWASFLSPVGAFWLAKWTVAMAFG